MIAKVKAGVYKIPVDLPASLEKKRVEFEQSILKAQEKIKLFADKHNWQTHVSYSIIETDKDVSYQQYKELIDYLIKKTSITTLLENAWRIDFIDKIKNIINK
jgi:hypothetical protein